MSLARPTGNWPPDVPPEVPPHRPGPPPHRPGPPSQPSEPRRPAPEPIIPTWEEEDATLRRLDVADRLLEQRIVQVGGHLDTRLANRVTARLLLLGRRDRRPIELHLTCHDSDLDPSLAVAGTVGVLTAPVHAVVHGTLVGPAVAVLCAAQERGAHRGATLVLSLPRTTAEGTADQLAVHAAQHERQVTRLRELIAQATGRDDGDVEEDLRAGRVLSADEALEYGLLDRQL